MKGGVRGCQQGIKAAWALSGNPDFAGGFSVKFLKVQLPWAKMHFGRYLVSSELILYLPCCEI